MLRHSLEKIKSVITSKLNAESLAHFEGMPNTPDTRRCIAASISAVLKVLVQSGQLPHDFNTDVSAAQDDVDPTKMNITLHGLDALEEKA